MTWGNGVFLSRDGGKTWTHGGLAATNHIGKIAVHPREPLTAYVAALGRVWGDNPERGLFVTRDGGKTWTHTLQLDEKTGCVDVAIDPSDPQTVYATAYRVRRDAYSGGNPAEQFGPRAGIYRSRDGGKTWTRLTRGLPSRPLGRIGLAVWRKDPRAVFAVVQTDRTDTRRVAGQPPKHTAANVDVGGVFYSNDRGETWQKVNDLCPRPFYFGQVRVDPTDHRRLWVLGIPLFVSSDAGQNFSAEGARNVHVDHHDLWIDPADPQHLILGNDGGLYYSRNRGKSWTAVHNLPISQFYHVAVDRRMPYHVYGGLQDNGTWSGPSRTSSAAGILNGDWTRVLHMDGFACAVPPDDPDIVYAEGQYGRLHRVSLSGKKAVQIQPRTPKNSPPFRFNWNAPLVLSPHDGRTLYFGGSLVFRSTDRGGTWSRISPDLTLGRSTSASYSHTLTALAESPRQRGLLYAGSDDGTLHVSRNTGGSWTDLTARLPGPATRTIACLEPSPHTAATVLACIDRHWQDDYRPHLYRSDDYGRTWRRSPATCRPRGRCAWCRSDPQPGGPVRRHRVRAVCLARRGDVVAAVRPGDAAVPGVRPGGPPTRPRAGRRHARPRHLDRRRRAAAGPDAGGAGGAGTCSRSCGDPAARHRPAAGAGVLVRRPEPADRRRRPLPPRPRGRPGAAGSAGGERRGDGPAAGGCHRGRAAGRLGPAPPRRHRPERPRPAGRVHDPVAGGGGDAGPQVPRGRRRLSVAGARGVVVATRLLYPLLTQGCASNGFRGSLPCGSCWVCCAWSSGRCRRRLPGCRSWSRSSVRRTTRCGAPPRTERSRQGRPAGDQAAGQGGSRTRTASSAGSPRRRGQHRPRRQGGHPGRRRSHRRRPPAGPRGGGQGTGPAGRRCGAGAWRRRHVRHRVGRAGPGGHRGWARPARRVYRR
ncbi:MAG: hypothetical protein U0736_07825 [Gemmataceae bacterium]